MIEKAFAVEPHRKAVVLIRHRSSAIAIGVCAFLLFMAKLLEPRRNYPRALSTHLTASRWNDPVLAESVNLPLRCRIARRPQARANG